MRKPAADLTDNVLRSRRLATLGRIAPLAVFLLAGGWANPIRDQDIGEGLNTMGFDMATEPSG
jgi:hypothetical protein